MHKVFLRLIGQGIAVPSIDMFTFVCYYKSSYFSLMLFLAMSSYVWSASCRDLTQELILEELHWHHFMASIAFVLVQLRGFQFQT